MRYMLEIALVGVIAAAVVAGSVNKSRMARPVPTDAKSQVARGKYIVAPGGRQDLRRRPGLRERRRRNDYRR